jgi:hypothetical protein
MLQPAARSAQPAAARQRSRCSARAVRKEAACSLPSPYVAHTCDDCTAARRYQQSLGAWVTPCCLSTAAKRDPPRDPPASGAAAARSAHARRACHPPRAALPCRAVPAHLAGRRRVASIAAACVRRTSSVQRRRLATKYWRRRARERDRERGCIRGRGRAERASRF